MLLLLATVAFTLACKPSIVGGLVYSRDHGIVVRRGIIAGLVVMIERRNRHPKVVIKRVDPGKRDVPVGFTFAIVKAVTGIDLISG